MKEDKINYQNKIARVRAIKERSRWSCKSAS
jgi:hypothetical protein